MDGAGRSWPWDQCLALDFQNEGQLEGLRQPGQGGGWVDGGRARTKEPGEGLLMSSTSCLMKVLLDTSRGPNQTVLLSRKTLTDA